MPLGVELGLRVQAPISPVLATWSSAYVAGLTATPYVGPSDSAEARDGFDRWVALAAAAWLRATLRASREVAVTVRSFAPDHAI